ncbi:MAG: glutamate dehydrogenase, partial [Thermoleophilaceae bacterium]|nr:glutamate dehydrogenase [Thermoleophilaceae bacterium]
PEIVTGKPAVLGGTEARRPATGLGVVYVTQAVLQRLDWELREQRFVVQGFGNVGSVAALELHRLGAKVVGVSDHTCGVVDPDGLDIPALVDWVGDNRFLEGSPIGKRVGRAEVLETSCDVLIPAAIERQITSDNADKLDCKLIVEGANGPTTPEAERMLDERGIRIVPDILANAGGVTVSYFEWVQDQQKYTWEVAQIKDRLRMQLRNATHKVGDAAEALDLDWRTAAMTVAVERVAQAAKLRAIYP